MSRTTRRSVFAGLAICALSGVLLSAQAPSAVDKAYLGSWKLNLAKSKYENLPTPKSGTRVHEDRGSGFVQVAQVTINADGSTAHSEYVYKPDGKTYPMAGLNQTGTQRIALKVVDARTVSYQITMDGKLTLDGKRTLSADGQTLTNEQTGKDAKGQPTRSVAVYDKQK